MEKETNKRRDIILLGSLLSLILLSCSKYKEPAPFSGGMYLEYKVGTSIETYKILALGSKGFKIVETRQRSPLPDDVEELFVDKYGRVYKSSFEPYEGNFSPIWIPVKKLKIGDTVDGRYLVARKDRWEKWEVLVLKDKFAEAETYFDLSTGFLVGAFAKTPIGPGGYVLVDTNAPIITVD